MVKKELKKENVVLASKTSNRLGKFIDVSKNKNKSENVYKGTGVYKLKCSTCNDFYIGQTGRSFKKRFSEHLPKTTAIQKSKFADHLINTKHKIDDIDSNMEILHKCRKSRKMTTLEQMEIYQSFKKSPQNVLNDKLKFN